MTIGRSRPGIRIREPGADHPGRGGLLQLPERNHERRSDCANLGRSHGVRHHQHHRDERAQYYENSALYDVGVFGIRNGLLAQYTDTDSNVAQFALFENNVIAGLRQEHPQRHSN